MGLQSVRVREEGERQQLIRLIRWQLSPCGRRHLAAAVAACSGLRGGKSYSCSMAPDDDLQSKVLAFDDHEYSLQQYVLTFFDFENCFMFERRALSDFGGVCVCS